MTAVTLVLTGLLYPLAVTGVAQVLFPRQANGSLVHDDGRLVGSQLIGQGFARPGLLPAAPLGGRRGGYDAAASSGSNLGPTSPKLRDRVAADVARLADENPWTGARPAGARDDVGAAASIRTSARRRRSGRSPRVAARARRRRRPRSRPSSARASSR